MSVYIKRRKTRKGEQRYLVFYRRGGRNCAEEYAGSFRSPSEARARRDWIRLELAAGRDPRESLAALKAPRVTEQRPGLEAVYDRWIRSRRDVGESAVKLYGNSKARWLPILDAATDPLAVTVDGVLAGIDEMLDDLAPSTVRIYLSHLAMVLDFALPDGQPNPARSRKIKLPQRRTETPPPTNAEWAAITGAIGKRSLLAVRLMECCALRVSEACGIRAGDIDVASGQILIRRSVTKTNAGRRWVPVPAALLDDLAERGSVGVSPHSVYYDLRQACSKAKTRPYGTHAFRRRRISLWYAQGVDGPQVARWSGHSKASESMDTYAYEVMDAFADEWLGFWNKVRRGERAEPVRQQEHA